MPARQSIFAFILVVAATFLTWLIIRDLPQKIETEKQLVDLKMKISALEKSEEKQKAMAEYLNSESYLEKQARIRLNLKKEGEEAVFIYRKDESGEQENKEKRDENPFLMKLKELFSFIIK